MEPATTIPLTIYGQDGKLDTLHVKPTPGNIALAEWLRKFDRYEGVGAGKETAGEP